MANITKTSSGKWRFQVTVNYKSHTKTFATKAEGYLWEEDLQSGKAGKYPKMTLAELLIKYRDEEIVKHKASGIRSDTLRVNAFLADTELVNIKLADMTTIHFAKWRDRRLAKVSNLSVLKELSILNPIFNKAVKEWKFIAENPLRDLDKPKKPPARDRLISQDEIDRLCFVMSYDTDQPIKLVTTRVCAGFLFAIETGLRAQEICNLRWVDIKGNVLKVLDSKTVAGIRDVPMSSRAKEIVEQCKGLDDSLVFGITTGQLDSLFRKAKVMAGITKEDNLHFHDTRHEAITRLAKKLDVLELARMVGHKDLNELLTYYNETAENISKKLA